jgi:hypothetical protein
MGTRAVPNWNIWMDEGNLDLQKSYVDFLFQQSCHRRWFRLKVIPILVRCGGLHTQQEIPGCREQGALNLFGRKEKGAKI